MQKKRFSRVGALCAFGVRGTRGNKIRICLEIRLCGIFFTQYDVMNGFKQKA